MRSGLVSCILLIYVIAGHESAEGHSDMEQKRLTFPPLTKNGWRAHTQSNTTVLHNTGVNGTCHTNNQCRAGLCCVLTSGHRSCQPLALHGALCSVGQIKGGYYHKHCPCLAGEHACEQDKFYSYHRRSRSARFTRHPQRLLCIA
uniref:Putative secreted protein n=1 Tax=Amblyomma americanum TaxID=6943 RepID=A0A0C9R5E2_AMBAM